MEVTIRFKGLDLIDRVPDELWNEVRDIVQETGIKTVPMEKKVGWGLILNKLMQCECLYTVSIEEAREGVTGSETSRGLRKGEGTLRGAEGMGESQ